MARNYQTATLLIFLLTISVFQKSFSVLVKEQPLLLKYHNGALLRGPVTVNLVWYGKFTPTQRSVIVDFLQSLNTVKGARKAATPLPSVSSWWKITEKYHNGSSTTVVGKQILDENYSLGKFLKNYHIQYLATKVAKPNSINVVLTGKEVGVERFCTSRCGTHGATKGKPRVAYAWVGNSETQCPGQCAWPFHQPIYGPQSPPLISPNGDVGVDGMVINLATVIAGAVTNPFNQGYFQGPATAPLEAVSACTGMFGSGSYPGYPGDVLVDKSTGASYNAHGLNGRKYLVPAMWDPKTSVCSTLV
ncbi:hypothetical protein LXL04_038604 [Taraxacum kok-saghyz]